MTPLARLMIAALACGWLAGGCGDSGQALLQRGMAAYENGNHKEAVALLTRASQRVSGSPELYYYLGCAHLRKGEKIAAETAFHAALELEPQHSEALAGMAQVAFYSEEPQRALELSQRALAGAPASGATRAAILNGLALAQQRLKRNDLARLELLRALQADRLYAPAVYNLASLYLNAYDLREEALDQFEIFTRIAGKHDPYKDKAANLIKRLRANVERLKAEENAGEQRDQARALKLLEEGIVAQSEKQIGRAMRAYRETLAADPRNFNAAFALARIYKLQRNAETAFSFYQKAAAINPDHQESHHEAARLALGLKLYDEAEQILDRAIARSPYKPVTAELMARLRFAQGRPAESRAYGEFYLSLLPADHPSRAAFEKWLGK